MFVIDEKCRTLRCEIMEGCTIFAGFSSFEMFNGLTLFELSEDLCKEMKLSRQQTAAAISAQREYESYKLMKAEENLTVG